MEDVFQTINQVTRSEEQNRAFLKPNFETVQPVIQVNKVNYGKATRYSMFNQSNNVQPCPVWVSNNFRDTNKNPRGSFKKGPGQPYNKHSPKKLTCYYCEGSTWSRTVSSLLRKVQGKTKRHKCGQVLQEENLRHCAEG